VLAWALHAQHTGVQDSMRVEGFESRCKMRVTDGMRWWQQSESVAAMQTKLAAAALQRGTRCAAAVISEPRSQAYTHV
jgi:hypothetical protein